MINSTFSLATTPLPQWDSLEFLVFKTMLAGWFLDQKETSSAIESKTFQK